jgi:hypothetical protein
MYLIECYRCEAVMGTEVRGEVLSGPLDEEMPVPAKVTLVECPQCGSALVGVQESYGNLEGGAPDWTESVRVWPEPPVILDLRIPPDVRKSLIEAHKCLKCRAYTASVGMSGRALEAIGRYLNPSEAKPLMLGAGLQKLYDDKVIDARLYEWGKALTQERHLAAHASGTHFRREDAEDVFKFTRNICEYIFVLSEQFEEFMERRKKGVQQ